jgi:hypothetical protein
VGNKIDLRGDSPDSIAPEYGENYAMEVSKVAKDYGFTVPYYETSAKTGEMVEKVFQVLGMNILAFLKRSA